MRTTIWIPDELFPVIKELAHKKHKSVSRFLTDPYRKNLAVKSVPEKKPAKRKKADTPAGFFNPNPKK